MFRSLFSALVLLVLATQPAVGQALPDSRVLNTITTAQVQSILAADGFAGSEIDADGDVAFRIEGHRVWIVLGEDADRLEARMVWVETQATLAKVNQWNRSKWFSKAYLDDDGDPWLIFDLDLRGGVTVGRIKSFVRSIRNSAPNFVREVVQ
jgi:hypothetical protein